MSYIEVTSSQIANTLKPAGFSRIEVPGTYEEVWVHPTENSRFEVRIFTSVALATGYSRQVGFDAIRATIFDKGLNRVVWEKRTNRTKSAMENMKERAREAYRASRNVCECGCLMVERCSKKPGSKPFLGCSGFPKCNKTAKI